MYLCIQRVTMAAVGLTPPNGGMPTQQLAICVDRLSSRFSPHSSTRTDFVGLLSTHRFRENGSNKSVWCASEEGEETRLYLSFHPIILGKKWVLGGVKRRKIGDTNIGAEVWSILLQVLQKPTNETFSLESNIFHPDNDSHLLCFISNMWLKCDKLCLNRSDVQISMFRPRFSTFLTRWIPGSVPRTREDEASRSLTHAVAEYQSHCWPPPGCSCHQISKDSALFYEKWRYFHSINIFITLADGPVCPPHPSALLPSPPCCVFALSTTSALVLPLWFFFFSSDWVLKKCACVCAYVCLRVRVFRGSTAVIRDRALECSDIDGWCFSHPGLRSQIAAPHSGPDIQQSFLFFVFSSLNRMQENKNVWSKNVKKYFGCWEAASLSHVAFCFSADKQRWIQCLNLVGNRFYLLYLWCGGKRTGHTRQ